jgi:hypothetical protein
MLNRRLKVGVTIFLRAGQQSIWENGIFQNCFFLAMLLQCVPDIEAVYLVNGGDGSPKDAHDFLALAPAPTIDLDTARETLDVVIELSAQLNPEWGRAFRARGGHIIGMRVANDYVIDAERMMFDLPHGMLVSCTPYSAIWTLPAFERTCKQYYAVALRTPVRTMQHLWSPQLMLRSMESSGFAGSFGYTPGSQCWRLGILEPNVCMVKTSHLSMLIADLAYRQNPEGIDYLRVFNTMHLKEDAAFVEFACSLDLVKQRRATFEPRLPIYDILGRQANMIVSHQWENAQNYLYYEVLYGGYPLIHNSDLLDGCGYGYHGFDCEEGALALREAIAVHDLSVESYRADARSFLEKLDPTAKTNVASYGAAIVDLFQ